jgi:hypothetical protein
MHALRIDSYRLIAGLALACASAIVVAPRAVAQDGDQHAIAAPRAAVFTGVRTAYVDGDRIGRIDGGADCRTGTDREWTPLVRQRIEAEVAQAFREELAKTALVQGTGSKAAPLKVHAVLDDLHVAVCQAGAGAWQGGFRVQVGWRVVAPDTGKVLYQASTQGAFTQATPQRMSSAAALHEAFAVAVRSLLGDRRFVAVLQDHGSRQLAFADI